MGPAHPKRTHYDVDIAALSVVLPPRGDAARDALVLVASVEGIRASSHIMMHNNMGEGDDGRVGGNPSVIRGRVV